MAISLVGSVTAQIVGGSTVSPDFGVLSWQTNDVATAFMARSGGSGLAAPGVPTGWTLIWNLGSALGTDRHSVLYGKRLVAPSENTFPAFDLPGITGDATIVLAVWRGVSVAEWEDAVEVVTVGENSTNPTNPAITTVTDGAMLVVMAHITHGGLTSMGAPANYNPANSRLLLHANSLMAYRIKTLAGVATPTAWLNVGGAATNDYTLVTYALRPQSTEMTVPVGLVTEANFASPLTVVYPRSPSGVTATAVDDDQVSISWNAITGATGYDVRRRQALDAVPTWGPWLVIETDWNTTTFIDTNLTQHTLYQYQVRSVFGLVETIFLGASVEFDTALAVASPPRVRLVSEFDTARPLGFSLTGGGGGGGGGLIFDVDFEAGLEGIEFTSDAGTLHDIINDPTPRAQGKVLRMTGDTSDGQPSGNRARVENNIYQADPQNLPFDGVYDVDFYLAQNQTSCNIFQFKQAFRHALSPHTGDPTYDAQTRILLWFVRVNHVSNGNHNFAVRGKLAPNGQWWDTAGVPLGTYNIATAPGTPVQTGQWHHIECHYKWAGDNTGRIKVILDGAQVCDVNQITRLPLIQSGPVPDGTSWIIPGDTTWKAKPMEWTINNYMIDGSGVWNPSVTANYFDNVQIRLPGAAGGTVLPAGANWDTIINSAPPNWTFLIPAGIHLGKTVTLRTGDTLEGEPGAVLDGQNTVKWAVAPNNVNNVTIRGLEIRNYRPDPQYAPITARTWEGAPAGIGWTVEDCDLHHNSDVGLHLSDGSVARNNNIHENGIIGIKVYWVRNLGALVEDNESWGNNTTGADEFWEAGGSKFAWTEDLIVRRNNVHDNNGPGLWTDIDNINTLYEDNIVTDNAGAGIFHEISYSGIIRRNTVRGNGYRNRGWLWEAGIMVAGSQDVVIEDNIVEDNFNGITLIQQNRGSGALGPWDLRNVTVQRNTVRGGRTGVVQDIGDNTVFTTRNLRYLDNDYLSTIFVWQNNDRTFAVWQGYGHDLTGSSG